MVLQPRKEAGAMAATTLTTVFHRRLYSFAEGIARSFSDSRRRHFLTDMVTGLAQS
jgi:hypothetical protein